jgi:Mn2+/Fe2+ NRAMP family transporter
VTAVDPPVAGKPSPTRLPRWLKRVLGLLAILGPGLIAANAGNDAGGILTYASAGSRFGYRTLVLMVWSPSRWSSFRRCAPGFGAYTGEGLGALLCDVVSVFIIIATRRRSEAPDR